MGVLSFLQKDQQESSSGEAEFRTRAEEESKAVRPRRKRKQNGEKDAPVDPVLPEKKRARRRLVGAVALVLAAIIGLPMMLDSEPKPLAEDIAIQIPSKDKASPAKLAGTRDAAVASAARTPAAATLDKGEEIVNMPAPAPAPATTSTVIAAAKPEAAAVAEAKPAARAEPHAAARQADAMPRQEVAAEKTKAAFEKKPARFMVQVAALASQEKASELQGKLRGAGIRAQAQKVPTQSGERIRVRVGPFASKEEAEKMRAKLNKMGLTGTLVPA